LLDIDVLHRIEEPIKYPLDYPPVKIK